MVEIIEIDRTEDFGKAAAIVCNSLADRGIYSKDLVYRGFYANFVDRLLQTGSDNDTPHIHANREQSLGYGDPYDPIYYLMKHGGLVVYDPKALDECSFDCYNVKEGGEKGIVAVFLVNDPENNDTETRASALESLGFGFDPLLQYKHLKQAFEEGAFRKA